MGVVKSVIGFIGRHLIVKEFLNDPELSKARQTKCSSCPMYDKENDKCKVCKCLIEVKKESKVSINPFHLHFEETHCPLGKWPIRLEDKSIGGDDKALANHYRRLQGKADI